MPLSPNRKAPIANLKWFALLLALPAALSAQESVVYEGYYLVKLFGQTCGRMHCKTVKVEEAGQTTRFVSTHDQKLVIRRGNDTTSSEETGTQIEDNQGTPLSFEEINKQSAEATTRKGTVKPGEVQMHITAAGQTQAVKIPYTSAFLFPHAESSLRAKKGFVPGTTYSYQLLLVDLGQVKEAQIKVLPPEKAALGGQEREWHVVQVSGLLPGVSIKMWCGGDGYWRRFTMDVNETEMVACTKAEWEKPIEAPRIDAMARNSVDPGVLLPVPSRMDEVVYKLSLSHGELGSIAFDDERQKIVKNEGGALTLHIKRAIMTDAEAVKLPLPATECVKMKGCLEPSPMVQSDDPALVKTAKDAVADETNTYRIAKKLERFVYENIKAKGYDTGFASAKEVEKNREGDCTEHAVWLAALLRAQGIPSKVAMGLSFAEGTFNYHMWTEAWLGRWVALDATLAGPSVDPAHIEMADSPLEGAGMGDKFLSVMQVFGRMKLDIEKVVLSGNRTLSGEQLKTPAKLENGCFMDDVLGISFPLPDGFSLFKRGAPLPNGKTLPRHVAAVLSAPGRGNQQIIISNVATPWLADLRSLLRQPDAQLQKVAGGKALAGQMGPVHFITALAPGNLFRIEIIRGDAPGDLAKQIIQGLKLGDEVKADPAK